MSLAEETTESSLIFSVAAATKVKELIRDEGNDALMLRVFISGGGCSGFQYSFKFDHETAPDDIFIDKNSIRVAIDPISANYLNGSEIDYTDDLIGSTFVITNPNAVASCGCGTSFSLG